MRAPLSEPNPIVQTDCFAAVVVDVDAPGLRQPFTYHIPPDLSDSLAPGDCVVVPFGPRETLGWVVQRRQEPPLDVGLEKIRDIRGAVKGDGSRLPPSVLQTARWMAQTYMADLARCVRSVIPDAQTAHVVRRIQLQPEWEKALAETSTPSHRGVIQALASFGAAGAAEEALQAAVGNLKLTSPLKLLRQRGVVSDQFHLEPPRMTARRVRAVRLSVPWDQADQLASERDARAPAQARVLRALASAGGSAVPQTQLCATAATTAAALRRLVSDGLVVIEEVDVRRRPFSGAAGAASIAPSLTDEQTIAVRAIAERLKGAQENVALLYGVTASGKTEVYLQAIAAARKHGRTALVLVPEIALTAQVVETFRARIGDRVAVLHSGLSAGERRDEWQRIVSGDANVVVGARSAVFAPLENIGLIVVDEEHEGSYKQDSPSPRYHARDVAIARARATGATVLLGSATPSMESFYRAESGEWGMLPLRQRALARPLPSVDVVDLREGYKHGERAPAGIFSPQLRDALADRLTKGEQSILFLNRRGFASFLLCRDCGFTTRCPHCDVSLTFHSRMHRLACHHCGFSRAAPTVCPSCSGDRIRPFGVGTEKVEEEVRGIFPEARVLRMDRDTTARKGSHVSMLRTFGSGAADILIGTQMVAKGLDFAGVTLVGVVSADTALNIPDFRASERAFQLLTQVSGRAGRGRKPGHVIVQTFNPEHESVAAAAGHDYESFYRREIVNRRELAYPPFTRLANVISQDGDNAAAEQRLVLLASKLTGRTGTLLDGSRLAGDDDLLILGPAPCPLTRLRGQFRWHLLLKAADPDLLRRRLRMALGSLSASERYGVSVDIDPMSLL